MRPSAPLAPVLLLVARLAQGLSVGGEYGTAATYMSEVAGKGNRGFYSSFQYVTLIGGQLLALLVLVVLQQALSLEELKAWGWRIPFFFGAVAAVVAMYLRRSLEETASAETMHHKEAGSLSGLVHHKRALLIMLAFTMGGSLYFYTFTTYMQKFLVNSVKMDAKDRQHDHDARAGHFHALAAGIRRAVGQDRPQQQHDPLQRACRARQRCRSCRPCPASPQHLRGFRPDHGRTCDRVASTPRSAAS